MKRAFILRGPGEPETLLVEGRAGSWSVVRGSQTTRTEIVRLPDGRVSLLFEDSQQICGRAVSRAHGEIEISSSRGVCRFALADPLRDRVDRALLTGGSGETEEEIRALMPGRVVEVPVRSGDRVPAGGLLLVLEAMKMQNEIRAERAGVVGRVEVDPGVAVEGGTLMLTIQSVAD